MSFILLKWATGKDNGKLSILEKSCVRGNDNLQFNVDGTPLSNDQVVVEWQAGKKGTNGSWPVYKALILRAGGTYS